MSSPSAATSAGATSAPGPPCAPPAPRSRRGYSQRNRRGSWRTDNPVRPPERTPPEAGTRVNSRSDGQDCPSSTHPAIDGRFGRDGAPWRGQSFCRPSGLLHRDKVRPEDQPADAIGNLQRHFEQNVTERTERPGLDSSVLSVCSCLSLSSFPAEMV